MSNPEKPIGKAIAIGIDVAKRHLDVAIGMNVQTFDNTSAGHVEIATLLKQYDVAVIIMEATGGYEAPLAVALQAQGLPVAIINPRQARDFAKGMGRMAKTDKVDALVLAQFGSVLVFNENIQRYLRKPPNEQREWLNAIVTRRR